MSTTSGPLQPSPPLDLPTLEECSCSSSTVTAIFVTIFLILIIQAVLYYLWKLYCKTKSGQHVVLVTDTEKGDFYAYDNPGFKEGPSLVTVEKENHKENQTSLKWPQWASIGLLPSSNKVKSMDDTFTSQPVMNIVPLRSHDFTGLGFNICGNMRDGIFVKDVLHRGPASESGRIMPGDRIESLKISLRHMVFEDALTILSYASPYEVELEVESRLGSRVSTLVRGHPPPNHKICHPFYKSHSISDLHQIEKFSSRRSGETTAIETSDLKPTTLEKKPKLLEAERYQNSRNTIIESSQKHETAFTTIDLDVPDKPPERPERTASPVKNILVKGIQNLREKLHNTLHQDQEQGMVVMNGTGSARSSPKRDNSSLKGEEGYNTVELCVPEEVTKAGVAARNKRQSVSEDNIDDDRKGKRKAPSPPQMEEEPISNGPVELDSTVSGTIELDSSHITVHQTDEGRKASSLGDLSRYESGECFLLERAVSLELEGTGSGRCGANGVNTNGVQGGTGKKRKAPTAPPPSDTVSAKEARLDVTPQTSTLKKSDVWGTLEDALHGRSLSDDDISKDGITKDDSSGISDCSTPPPLNSSTPYKFPDLSQVSVAKLGDKCWDLSAVGNDFTNTMNGDASSESGEDTPPQLPTSPIPPLHYITEIQVHNQDDLEQGGVPLAELRREPVEVNSSNEEEASVLHLNNNLPREFVSLNDISSCDILLCVKNDNETKDNKMTFDLTQEINTVKSDKSIDNNTEGKTISTISITGTESLSNLSSESPEPLSNFNATSSESLPDLSSASTKMSMGGRNAERSLSTSSISSDGPTLQRSKFSIVEIDTDSSSQNNIKKGSNVSVTNIKGSTSRIPVRAGQRSPGGVKHSPELRRLRPARNGHHSP